MDISVQEAIQDLITALVKSLGSSNGKLLTLMRTCPPGSESLALRVLTIFTEHGRPSAQLVALVKGLISERDLDARFLIPIIAEMDKVKLIRNTFFLSVLNSEFGRRTFCATYLELFRYSTGNKNRKTWSALYLAPSLLPHHKHLGVSHQIYLAFDKASYSRLRN